MKKTIIFVGLALVAFSNVALATTNVITTSHPVEVITYDTTPLCNAIIKGDVATVKKFIEYGADVNESANGTTPLMLAARYNKVEIIKLLIEKGARIDTKDDKGFTALKYAEISKANDAVAYLKQA